MQNRLEEHPDFKSKYEDKPIETLEEIKKLIHNSAREQNPTISTIESMIQMINKTQYENKNIIGYLKWCKQTRDVVRIKLGTEFLDTFVRNQEEYRTCTKYIEQSQTKNDTLEKWIELQLIKGGDESKYDTLIKGFVSRFSSGIYHYQKTIIQETDILSNHKLDQKLYEKNKPSRDKASNNTE